MSTTLIIIVGGSDEPIVQAIKSYNPNFIYFICSGGSFKTASAPTIDSEGKVCIRKKEVRCPKCKEVISEQEEYPSIIKQSNYKGGYEKVIIDDPDNFDEVYEKIKETIEKAKKEGEEIICDFTGGTKIMSSILAILTAFDFNLKLSFSKGKREDIIKITKGSIPVIENINLVRVDFIMNSVDFIISKYLYYPAKLLLEELIKKGLPSNLQKSILEKIEICSAFYYWDNFEYETAFEILKSYTSVFKQQFNYLMEILGKGKYSGYEPVFDLIKNAERQAKNGFYDNGVARLYRTIELLAQIRLKNTYGIDTSSIEKSLDKLKNPEKWEKEKNEEGKIQVGVIKAYELLTEMGDEIGKIYEKEENQLKNVLKIRNFSKLAHGNTPITEEQWNNFFTFSKTFIEDCLSSIGIKISYPEFPDKIII